MTVLDVRPDREVVAYCRGPYCVAPLAGVPAWADTFDLMIAELTHMRRGAGLQGRSWLCAAWLFGLLLSGAPTLAAKLYAEHFECCDSECEGADDDGDCPPNCDYGTCAKTISTMPQAVSEIGAPTAVLQPPTSVALLPAPSGVRGDVFHPPRA